MSVYTYYYLVYLPLAYSLYARSAYSIHIGQQCVEIKVGNIFVRLRFFLVFEVQTQYKYHDSKFLDTY